MDDKDTTTGQWGPIASLDTAWLGVLYSSRVVGYRVLIPLAE